MNFDRLATSYRLLETLAFGNALQRARTAFISQIRDNQRALIAGEGDGRFLAEFLRVNPSVQIDCVDASRKMLVAARQRLPVIGKRGRPVDDSLRLRFHHADIRDWAGTDTWYDVIVTHFFLDCFDRAQLSRVVHNLATKAGPKATWLVADFAVPSNRLSKLHAEVWLRIMYSFFVLTAGLGTRDLVDPSPFLEAAGFDLREETTWRFGLIKSQLWKRSS